MKKSFNTHLVKELGSDLLNENNLLDIMSIVKIRINKFLTEEDAAVDEKKFTSYLKFVAIFEQFFRFLEGHKIGLEEIPGINAFVNNEKLDDVSEVRLQQKIEDLINRFTSSHSINFKNIADQRFNAFVKWFKEKRKDDLKVINDSIDYITKTIREFNGKQSKSIEPVAA